MGPVLAALQGFLVNSGVAGWGALEQPGYTVGTADHYVLDPGGLRAADPTRFGNDFFLSSSPEPHWFFDYVTALGASTNLSVVFFLYWCVGLAFFGFGAAMLARRWAPRMPWIVGLAFTVLMFLAPWFVAGTGSPMIASPIPAVVGGYAAFFTVAALVSGHPRVAAVMATVTSILHVQQGLVVALVLGVTFVALWVRDKRMPVWVLIGTLGAAAGTAYGMIHSGFGASIADFVQVCDEMIPYHCSAHLWAPNTMVAAIALIVLSAFSIRLAAPQDRLIWATSIGLIGFGLLSGMLADYLRIPALGALAQGSNIYRLGAIVIFFAVWGLLSFVIRPARTRWDAVFAVAWLIVSVTYLRSGGWQFYGADQKRIYVILLPLLFAGALAPWLLSVLRRREPVRIPAPAGVIAVAGALVVAAIFGGFIVPRPLNAAYIPDPAKREWGAAVEALVPPGEVLLHSPNAPYIRLATKRADIADCKSVPYGGKPYAEWKKRIDDLGGWATQCRNGFPTAPFNDLSAADLDRVAQRYDIHYMVLEQGQLDVLPGLEELGWSVALKPINSLDNYVLHKG
ncbi:DUF6798 domain-containing protein [Microbacterium arabinogalactanolyticum]|uniref:DUF6798 domain-containing protein n=1 Tax=Microbacterium arabinogalactanolyticum TaxID=69365 RepID=UPI00404413DC